MPTAFFLPEETPSSSADPSLVSLRRAQSVRDGPDSPPCGPVTQFQGEHKGHLHPELFCKVGTLNHSAPVSSTLPSLCIYTNTHPLPPMSYICLHYWEKKANETVIHLSSYSSESRSQLLPVIPRLSTLTSGGTSILYLSKNSNYTSQRYIIKTPHSNCSLFRISLGSVSCIITYYIIGLLLVR